LTWRQRLSVADVKVVAVPLHRAVLRHLRHRGAVPAAVHGLPVTVRPGTARREHFIGLDNSRTLFADTQFWNALVNTISIFVLSTGPQIVIAVLLAALLNSRLRLPTSWRVGVLLPYVVSLVALGIIFANLFGPNYGLVNGVLETGRAGPDRLAGQQVRQPRRDRDHGELAVDRLQRADRAGRDAGDPEGAHEAALIDGAGAVRRFFSVTLPLLKPTLIFVTITSTIGGLQIFTEPKLFDAMPGSNNGGSTNQFQTITLYMYQTAFETPGARLRLGDRVGAVLVIIVIALINFLLVRRIASTGVGGGNVR
jgi:cellobiose transport system permease protein